MLNTKSIGNKIAEGRKKLLISQAELAQRLFISPQAVGKWERGESMPDITMFNRLAEIFGVDLNYFSENLQSASADVTSVEPVKELTNKPTLPEQKKKSGLSWNMSGGNWVDADFSGLKNLREKFSGSNMQGCKFIGSDLSELVLEGNNIKNCDFSNSDLRSSKIRASNVEDNLFVTCSLIDTEFSASEFKNCNFSNADFSGIEIGTSELRNCNAEDVVWKLASFKTSHIADVVFNGLIEDCSFENCSFSRVTFRNATILNTFFKGKRLKGIVFVDCRADRITYEFLKAAKADVTGITLVTS